MIPSILCENCGNLYSQEFIVEHAGSFYCTICYKKIAAIPEPLSFSKRYPTLYSIIETFYTRPFKILFHSTYILLLIYFAYALRKNIITEKGLIYCLIALNIPYALYGFRLIFNNIGGVIDDMVLWVKDEITFCKPHKANLPLFLVAVSILILIEYMIVTILQYVF